MSLKTFVIRASLAGGLVFGSACGSDPAAPADVGLLDAGPDGADPDVATDTDTPADTASPDPFRFDLSLVPPAGAVVAGITAKASDLVGGPKAEGLVGDLKMANHKAAFIIEGVRAAGGYRQNGGHLVDLDLQPGGEDRFGELWFAWNFRAFTPDTATIVSDGSDGLAVVRVSGRLGPYAWIDGLLAGLFGSGEADLAVTLEYSLAADTEVLELVIRLENDSASNVELEWPLVAANMGDGAAIFTPGPGFGNVASGDLPAIMAVGMGRSYALVSRDPKPPAPLIQVSSVQLASLEYKVIFPGQSAEYRFAYIVAADGTNSIDRIRHERFGGDAAAIIRGRVDNETDWPDTELLPSNSAGKTRVVVTRGDDVVALTPVQADGSYELHVPPGSFDVQAFAPARGSSPKVAVTAAEGAPAEVVLALPDLGRVDVRVRDPEGAVIPGQVQFWALDPQAPPHFGPEASRVEPDWGRGRSAVVFVTEPEATVHLLPGDYRAYASRGYSWEIEEFIFTVVPGTTETLTFTLEKTVDDEGWSAADLHLHAFWSPDSHVPYPTRLKQAAANDIALPVFTEHTYMGELASARAAADVDAWVTPIHGQEVSTTEYGHFNAYPLELQMDAPGFGAVFEHGLPGATLFDAIKAQHGGDKIIQINHPRTGGSLMGYFNAVDLPKDPGVDPAVAPTRPARWSTDWDLIEVFNERCLGGDNDQSLVDWMQLYDRGVRKGLASGSDSHSEAAGLGHPRSWIPVARPAVDADPQALVGPLRERRSFVSCGPFVRFATAGGVGIGGLATIDGDGEVRFDVAVEAPSWMRVDTVRLLERGEVVATVDVAAWNTDARPDGLRAGVRFQGQLVATPARSHDTWYMLEVIGSGGLGRVHSGDQPYALTNPIDVDANGDGVWTSPMLAGAKSISSPSSASKAGHHHHDKHDHDHHRDHDHGGEGASPEAFRALLKTIQAQRASGAR